MTNVLPPPPVNSTGQPGQAAYIKANNANLKLAALSLKGGAVVVPNVSGATGSSETTKMLYKVAGQQHANRQFDGGRRTKKSRKRKNRNTRKKYRKKSRR